MNRTNRSTRRSGFTLLEVAIATIIIAIGITALLTASASCTKVNAAGEELTTATFLAQEIREYCAGLDPCDVKLAGSYCPPVDASLTQMTGLTDWKQSITLQYKNPGDLSDSATATDVRYVSVTVKHNDANVLTTSWLVTKAP
jgi:prepilin-type N-terminal cleavage/methylation domain-containing protein